MQQLTSCMPLQPVHACYKPTQSVCANYENTGRQGHPSAVAGGQCRWKLRTKYASRSVRMCIVYIRAFISITRGRFQCDCVAGQLIRLALQTSASQQRVIAHSAERKPLPRLVCGLRAAGQPSQQPSSSAFGSLGHRVGWMRVHRQNSLQWLP